MIPIKLKKKDIVIFQLSVSDETWSLKTRIILELLRRARKLRKSSHINTRLS